MKKLDLVGRKGGYDEDGKLIIPFDYVEICALNDGVYYAREDFQKADYHLYTAKGRLDYPKTITNIQWDNQRNLLAVYGKDNTAEIVEVDYESNTLKTIYSNCITNVAMETDDLLSITCINGNLEIFSRKQKKVIASFDDKTDIDDASDKGFVCSDGKKQSFWNVSGEKILDGFKEIIMYNDFLVVDKAGLWGVYSHEGKELIPCKYCRRGTVDGVVPFNTEIDGKEVWLFRVHDLINFEYWRQKLITIDNKEVIYTDMEDEWIYAFGTPNLLVKGKKKDTLYKIEKEENGIMTIRKVFEAKKITDLSDGNFEVIVGCKKGVCNTNGKMIKPLRFAKEW